MNCDLKTSAQAWNDGITAFQNAFMLSGDATKSIKFALNELTDKHPNLEFDHSTFYTPLIASLKEKGLVDKNYQFAKAKLTGIEKALDNFKDLNNPDKKKLAESLSKKKQITPQVIKNEYAALKGLPHFSDEMNALIDQVATDRQAYEKIQSDIGSIFGEIQKAKKEKTYTKEKEKEFSDKLDDLNKQQNVALENYLKSDIKFGEALHKGRHFVYQYGDIMKMNLMNPTTLLKNMTGMVTDGVFRNLTNLVSAPTSALIIAIRKGLKKTSSSYGAVPIAAKITAIGKGNANIKAKLYAKYGTDPVYTDQLRTPNFIDGTKNIKKLIDGDKSLANTLGAIFKFSSAGITRGLGAPDFLFQETSKIAELNRLGKQKGYEGAELKAFIMAPDAKSAQMAEDYSKKITYKQDLSFLGGNLDFDKKTVDFAKIGDKLIEDGANPFTTRLWTGLLHAVKNMVVPFIKTPVNLLRNANALVLPEYTLAKGLIEAKKMTDPDEALQKVNTTVFSAMLGFHFRSVILNMIAAGLISAGYDDEEQKAKEIIEKKTGGSGRFNVNALWRGLTFQEIKEKKGDVYVDNAANGAIGIAIGAYAHAYSNYSKEDMKKEADWLRDGKYFESVGKTFASEMAGALDNSFFSGINMAQRAIEDKEGHAFLKYINQSLMTMIGGLIPATHQQLSKAATEERNKTYDKNLTFGQNVYNTLGYNFGFGSFGTPTPNYNALTEKGGTAKKTKDPLLFDNYWGRLLATADPYKGKEVAENTPVTRLYDAMRAVPKEDRDNLMPGLVDDEINVGSKKKGKYVKLSPEQYEYVQQRASLHRMMLAAPFIMSKDFDKADFDTKVGVLQGLYNEGRDQAIKDLKAAFPNIKGTAKEQKKKKDTVKGLLRKY
ncbi:MAG TPA: hypothetical protein ACFYEK_01425 [Candidatus Wunengus sp. YC60]|uniref:hypothetical protein n=1 Tax=Candidatus Wunengus sp. YC60 TaxID=3367697 RepID=UPI0040295A75